MSKMESFKISDTHRPQVSSVAQRTKDTEGEKESFSLGYEKIEKILENEDPQVMLAGLNGSLEQLRSIESEGSNKEKLAAGKAAVAYERTIELLDYLFQTKEALQNQSQAK